MWRDSGKNIPRDPDQGDYVPTDKETKSGEIKSEARCLIWVAQQAPSARKIGVKLGFSFKNNKNGRIIKQWYLCCAICHALCCSRPLQCPSSQRSRDSAANTALQNKTRK